MASRNLQHDIYNMLMESQYWPPDKLVAYQRSQLESLLRHAKANVPFYERRLNRVFARDGSIDWDRWAEIPIVTRQDLVEHRDAMQANVLPPGHGPTSIEKSSGSTGLPMTVTSNRLAGVVATACGWRAQGWHNLDWSRTVCARRGEDPTVSSWPEGRLLGIWGPPWEEQSRSGQWYEINRLAHSGDLLEFIGRVQATYYVTAPKPAHMLALEAERLGIDVRLDAILTHGEGVGDADRERVAAVFGAKMVELYSSKEAHHIAHDCPGHRGFHTNAEAVFVEILNEEGAPCGEGETGRVILTPFFMTAQPLVRYDQGDLATVGRPCGCGRTLPTLDRIDGRVTHMFRHPDGRRVAEKLPDICRQLLNADLWQVAQVGPREFEIRYTQRNVAAPNDESQLRRIFRNTYFEDAQIALRPVADIPLTAGGKFIEYVYEATPHRDHSSP